MKQIGIIAEFNPDSETHKATVSALEHSCSFAGLAIKSTWISTDEITPETINALDGVWLCTGVYKNEQNTIDLVSQARERGVPTLGTCGGFQHIILELGQNVLGLKNAAHEEYNPGSSTLLVTKLTCSLAGREMNVKILPESKVFALYGRSPVTERYYCSYGVNPEFVEKFEQAGVRIVASDDEGVVRAIELPNHPFFIGTLYVPQAGSSPERPHPIVTGFLRAVEDFGR